MVRYVDVGSLGMLCPQIPDRDVIICATDVWF